VVVRDLGRRWGTCTTGAEPLVALHWALFQLSPRLIDVVIVPELAHLIEPRHGPKFSRQVEQVIPDHRDRLAELAKEGRRVWSPDGATWAGQCSGAPVLAEPVG